MAGVCGQIDQVIQLLTNVASSSCPVVTPAPTPAPTAAPPGVDNTPTVVSIRISRNPFRPPNWLHISEIIALDNNYMLVPLEPVRVEPMGEWAAKYPLRNALTGRIEEFAHADWSNFALMEFAPAGGPWPIRTILNFNVPGLSDRFRDTKVEVRTTKGFPIMFIRCGWQPPAVCPRRDDGGGHLRVLSDGTPHHGDVCQ